MKCYLLHPTNPISDAIIVIMPVTASDLSMSFELLFHVIEANTAKYVG